MIEAVSSQPASAGVTSANLGKVHEVELAPHIKLCVCPGKEISWEEFQQAAPPFSIALDGIVRGAPKFDPIGPRANFNHHQDVDRLSTRCTSGQILVALKQGLIDSFTAAGAPRINIYVNDPDQDSSLAVWLLQNHERVVGTKSEPIINKLISAEDFLDTTGGAYPLDPRSSLMRELAWVFEPYVQSRMAGRIQSMEGPEMANVIDAVGTRISKYTLGKGGTAELDTRFEELGGGKDWRLIKEQGFYARTGLFSRGIKAFVSFLREDNGKYHYSIGKMSPFVPFPITDLYAALNDAEGLTVASGVCWNGGDIIGGSPRRVGSSLPPQELERTINHFLELYSVRPHA